MEDTVRTRVADIPAKRFMTRTELADAMKVSPATISRWAKSGRIPCLRAGLTMRFDVQEVIRALTAGGGNR